MIGNYIRRGMLAVLATVMLTAPIFTEAAVAEEITVKHSQGELVLKATPKKVAVFDLAALDTLDALEVEVTGAAGGFFPPYLSKFADPKYANVGSLFEPDYEAINALKPDLVIVGGRSSAKYADLAKLAPTIDLSTDDKGYQESVIRNAETLAKIFGKQDAAAARIAKLKASIEDLKALSGKAGKGLIVLTTGGYISAYGPGSRFGVLHDDFGVTPAAEGLSTALHGEAISHEFILKTNPDWLFVVDRDAAIGQAGQSAAQFLDNELVRQTTAWKKGQVVYLDPVNWYLVGGGLTSMQRDVDQLTEAFRKKL